MIPAFLIFRRMSVIFGTLVVILPFVAVGGGHKFFVYKETKVG